MTPEVKAPDEVAEMVKVLPAHLLENFEKAEARIKELYGLSPGVPALNALSKDELVRKLMLGKMQRS